AEAGYINQAHRWNWGLIGGQVPYLSGGFQSGIAVDNSGQPVGVDQLFIFRQTERSASGLAAHPFNRAQRVEFQARVTQISFDEIVDTTTFDLNTGAELTDNRSETSLANTLNLGTTSAAFVTDTSNFGATSPVAGERYRFEVDPTFGTINYTGVLADYRRYF